jgi:protein O-GlcNAc transferase
MLPLEDAPERHRLRSESFAKEKFPFDRFVDFKKAAQIPKRLKVGYFSADFYDHATMHLMAQTFEQHNKEQFEICAYSYGPDKQDEMRKRLIESVNVFHDVREMSDMQIVELARSEQIDIAIDLKGFTKGTRLAPFAHGLAPVQISYLGYPGTLGADFIDYIVADPVIIPEDKRQHYSEQIIYLPHTYQPTDNKRIISDKVITREDVGLPKDGFVFCCFNNNYKISSQEFDIWMRLLQKVEGSVLWLLKSNKWAEQNLKREAEARGVNADRLIFAEKLPQAEHLARQNLADLFLDTFNVNAHTTTSDALWAGLPVITKLGKGFAARVAGSLLHAVGLPELVNETEEQYEALALELATSPERLNQIKAKLAENRLTQPLFDTEQYTRYLETGYKMAFERFLNGQAPEHVYVKK